MDVAGAVGSTLATTAGNVGPQAAEPRLGPGLQPGMGEAALISRLNSWGADRDAEILRLRAALLAAQAGVTGTFGPAERARVGIATDRPPQA